MHESSLITRAIDMARSRRQFIFYGIIGLSGASIDFVGYLILYKIIGITPPIASFISVTLGITNNYILNSKFNFKVNDQHFKRFANFYAIGLTGAVFSALLIYLQQKLGLNPTIAKLITIPPIVLGQYIFNKRFSFAAKNE